MFMITTLGFVMLGYHSFIYLFFLLACLQLVERTLLSFLQVYECWQHKLLAMIKLKYTINDHQKKLMKRKDNIQITQNIEMIK